MNTAEKLKLTLELHQAGIEMKRLQFQRQYPQASAEDIQVKIRQWLQAPMKGMDSWAIKSKVKI